MGTLKQKRDEGFTIIEVLIVLVIAGLIMLIVFLAVPALQRNSRNTSRRDDASRVLAAANEWKNNNNNRLPTSAAADRQEIDAIVGDYSHYDSLTGIVQYSATVADLNSAAVLGFIGNPDNVALVTGASCNGAKAVDASANNMVVIHSLETGGNNEAVCIGG